MGGERGDIGGGGGVADALRDIVGKGLLDNGRASIVLEVDGDTDMPGVVYCWVKIHGDTTADRDTLKQTYLDKGWTCKNTSKTDAKCTSP